MAGVPTRMEKMSLRATPILRFCVHCLRILLQARLFVWVLCAPLVWIVRNGLGPESRETGPPMAAGIREVRGAMERAGARAWHAARLPAACRSTAAGPGQSVQKYHVSPLTLFNTAHRVATRQIAHGKGVSS
jgi:hypothetical protein